MTEKKPKITAIPQKYKDTHDYQIDGSDTEDLNWSESLNWLGPINKANPNVLRSRDSSLTFLETDHKNISVILFMLASKI